MRLVYPGGATLYGEMWTGRGARTGRGLRNPDHRQRYAGGNLEGWRTVAARSMVLLTPGLSVTRIQIPGLAALLHLKPLHLNDWVVALGGALIAAAVVLHARFRPTAT